MSLFRALLLCSFVLLAGCSWFSEDEEIQPAELVDFKQERVVKAVLGNSVASSLGSGFHELQPGMLGDRVFLVDSQGGLFAVNAQSGKTLWSQKIDSTVIGGVGVGDGKAMVTTIDGRLQVYSALDGAFLWEAFLNAEALAPAQANSDAVIVQSIDGLLRAFNPNSGVPLWSYKADLPLLTLRGTSTPLVVDNALFAGFANGKVVALDLKSGSVGWESRVALPKGKTELERIVDVDGQIIFDSGILYVSSYQGRLVALNASTGKILWSKDLSSYRSTAIVNGHLIAVNAEGDVIAFDKSNGLELWRQEALFLRSLTNPAIVSGAIAVADYQGYVHFLAIDDGHFIARSQVDSSGVQGPLIAIEDRLYVYGNSGRLAVLTLE